MSSSISFDYGETEMTSQHLRHVILLTALSLAAGCSQSPSTSTSPSAAAITAADAAVADGRYSDAISGLSDASLAHPDDVATQRAMGRAFAARAGATPERAAQAFTRQDTSGNPSMVSLQYVLIEAAGLMNYGDGTTFQLRIDDLTRAMSMLQGNVFQADVLPVDTQAQLCAVATELAGSYVLQILGGQMPDALTDDAIAAAVGANYDRFAAGLTTAYAVAMQTRSALVTQVAGSATAAAPALTAIRAAAPATLDPAVLTRQLQLIHDTVNGS
jgi:hypothetical protein